MKRGDGTELRMRVADMLLEDKRLTEIADALGIGLSAIKWHVAILKKAYRVRTMHGLALAHFKAMEKRYG